MSPHLCRVPHPRDSCVPRSLQLAGAILSGHADVAGPSGLSGDINDIADGIAESTATEQASLRTPAYTPRDYPVSVGTASGMYISAAPSADSVGDAIGKSLDAGLSSDVRGAD